LKLQQQLGQSQSQNAKLELEKLGNKSVSFDFNLDYRVLVIVLVYLLAIWLPISRKTEELENLVSQQVNTYGNKAKATAAKPVDYYRKQETFYQGLFWICVLILIVLWMLSGS
ncbi:2749_t:CDS:2, partial [Ambispora gerdemannii]